MARLRRLRACSRQRGKRAAREAHLAEGACGPFDRHKRDPPDRAATAAEIVVSFELDRTGHILESHIERSSGDAAFDAAALAMMRRSDPVPVPPALVADEGLKFTLPVVFRVKGKR